MTRSGRAHGDGGSGGSSGSDDAYPYAYADEEGVLDGVFGEEGVLAPVLDAWQIG